MAGAEPQAGCRGEQSRGQSWSGYGRITGRTPELHLLPPPRLLRPSEHRSKARGQGPVAELMPRASHFISACMNGLIVGEQSAGSTPITRHRGSAGVPPARPPCARLSRRRAGLREGSALRGDEGTPKPCPSPVAQSLPEQSCVTAAPPALQVLSLLFKFDCTKTGRKINIWTWGRCGVDTQGPSTPDPSGLTAGWRLTWGCVSRWLCAP